MQFRLYLIVLFLFHLWVIGCTDADSQTSERTPLILISIDGVKPSYLELTDTPVLDSLIQRGVMAESMIPVYPTNTFPNHYSLVTGLYTENSGVISNTMYDAEMERWFRLSDRSAVGDGRWYGGEPIWVNAEKNDIRTATMFWPGSEAEIQGVRPTRWFTYDGSLDYYARADSIIHWLQDPTENRPDFMTLYFSKVDGMGHRYGPYADSTLAALTFVDDVLGHLVNRLEEEGFWPNVNMLITSDHGMIDLSDDRLVFLDDIIDLDDVNVINWSPAVMMQPVEGKKMEVYEALKAREDELEYRVFLKEDIPERFRFKNHHRVPDILMMADLGWTITNHSFYERRGILGGTHGFDNEYPDMHTFFLAAGKDFKQGEVIPSFEVVHIYELMAYMLGVEPAPNDGDLSVLRGILNR